MRTDVRNKLNLLVDISQAIEKMKWSENDVCDLIIN